jgi:hypothetical protein
MTHVSEQSAESKFPLGIRRFGVFADLHKLRAQIHTWRSKAACDLKNSEVEELICNLRGLANSARTTGYDAYGCVCLYLAERIEELQLSCHLSRSTMKLLNEWGVHSESYLRHPREPTVVLTLIMHLNHPKWKSPFCLTEQNMLARALLSPATQ